MGPITRLAQHGPAPLQGILRTSPCPSPAASPMNSTSAATHVNTAANANVTYAKGVTNVVNTVQRAQQRTSTVSFGMHYSISDGNKTPKVTRISLREEAKEKKIERRWAEERRMLMEEQCRQNDWDAPDEDGVDEDMFDEIAGPVGRTRSSGHVDETSPSARRRATALSDDFDQPSERRGRSAGGLEELEFSVGRSRSDASFDAPSGEFARLDSDPLSVPRCRVRSRAFDGGGSQDDIDGGRPMRGSNDWTDGLDRPRVRSGSGSDADADASRQRNNSDGSADMMSEDISALSRRPRARSGSMDDGELSALVERCGRR